jgi:hypothetical protein
MNPRKPSQRTTEMDWQFDLKVVAEIGDQGVPDRFVEILRGLDPLISGGSKNESR